MVDAEKQTRSARREAITRFIADIEKLGGPLAGFDEALWYATVDSVTVYDGVAAFAFKDGTVVPMEI